MSFDFTAAIAARPSGDTRTALVAFYGDPALSSTRTGRSQFEPPASYRQHLTKIPLGELPGFPAYADPGVKITGVTFHEKVAPIFLATWLELDRRGLTGQLKTYDGSVTFRHQLWNYDNPVSMHAYGGAIDFDARWNGYGKAPEAMQISRAVVRCFEECSWESGARWRPTDGMHFQWTDPLFGVSQAQWRDALGRATPPVPASPPPSTVPPGTRVVLSRYGQPFEDISSARVEIKDAGSVVINATDPSKTQVRVS